MSEDNRKRTRSRTLNRLAARQVETAAPGAHADGGGLYLRVSASGSRKWELRYTSPTTGKRVDMGLGKADKGHVSLASARQIAATARDLVGKGLDPIAEKERAKVERLAAEAKAAGWTFGAYAEDWMNRNVVGFRNAKHRAQWHSTLHTYAASLWMKPLDAITTDDVKDVLLPIWATKPETAKRTQGRIEAILDGAKAENKREGDNPARWRGHLNRLLPKRPKFTRGHHAALPYDSAPMVLAAMRTRSGVASRALEFLILTAARSGEVRGMTWGELDSERKVWTVPAARMKSGVIHRVPLGARALEILACMDRLRPTDRSASGLVFPGAKEGVPLSDMTLSAVLRRMEQDRRISTPLKDPEGRSITVHGFRSTFRDWAEDVAHFPPRVAEAALAHTIKDKAEAAYRRGDAFDRRRALMQAWENYLGATPVPSDVAAATT